MGKKILLSKILYYSGLINIINFGSFNRLIVCNYHRLYNGQLNTSFDDGVFAHSVSSFQKHLKWLKKNTNILSEEDIISLVKSGRSISNSCSLVTFDDGYIDNYTFAYPILKRLGIPAIYFVPTDSINTRRLGWWDIIAYLIKKTNKTAILYNNELVSLGNPDSAIRFFQKIIKTKPYEETADLLFKLSEACNVTLPEIDTQSKELMTWDQIREVSQNGIAIGSHTHSHRVLSTISINEQKKDMVLSKSIIENEIGKVVRSIAYPVGSYSHFTRETEALVPECGYNVAFSFNTGVNYANNFFPFAIKRIEPSIHVELLAATAVFPKIFV